MRAFLHRDRSGFAGAVLASDGAGPLPWDNACAPSETYVN